MFLSITRRIRHTLCPIYSGWGGRTLNLLVGVNFRNLSRVAWEKSWGKVHPGRDTGVYEGALTRHNHHTKMSSTHATFTADKRGNLHCPEQLLSRSEIPDPVQRYVKLERDNTHDATL